MERSAGILLPVFSLPGPYGIGSLGREARAFAEFLHNAGQRWWQVLPVGPTGAGNSPYTSESTFAGNPLLIDLEDLRDRGLLTEAELSAARVPEGAPIDYAALYERREPLLRRAFSRLDGAEAQSVRDFAAANPWLGEYALYRALKARFGQTAWFDWPDKDLLNHDPAALAAARQELAEDIAFHPAVQFWCFSQWKALKDHANGQGVRIIGDLPIYVSLDCWTRRGGPAGWRACRRTTSRRRASCGATPCTTGRPRSGTASAGGSEGWRAPPACSTPSALTISGPLSGTGPSPPGRRPPRKGSGSRAPAWTCCGS